jgi:hypothetical protein
MYVEFVGDWKELKDAAEKNGCYRMSIQSCYTFFCFRKLGDAEKFLDVARSLGLADARKTVNVNRPMTPAEVIIRNRH